MSARFRPTAEYRRYQNIICGERLAHLASLVAAKTNIRKGRDPITTLTHIGDHVKLQPLNRFQPQRKHKHYK